VGRAASVCPSPLAPRRIRAVELLRPADQHPTRVAPAGLLVGDAGDQEEPLSPMLGVAAMTDSLTARERQAIEATLLRALRVRYPGRLITVEWDEPNTLIDAKTTTRLDDESGEHAA
jgi:hypothetical protein